MAKALFLAALLSLAGAARGDLDSSLVSKLREGGYVLYMRHASTDFGQNDASMTSYEDCPRQRNLTEKGRAEARSIAQHLKRLGVPIGEVLASPFCRTMETARLAFGRATATHDVRGGPVRSDDPKRYEGLVRLLASPVPRGENRVISSHGNPFQAVAGPPYLAEGEIAIVRPEGGTRFTVLARIRPEGWSSLPGGAGRASSAAP
jgi:hypothetical protein